MNMQFQKVFETLSMILMPPEELERQQQARQGGAPSGPGGPMLGSPMQQGPPRSVGPPMQSGPPSPQASPMSAEQVAPMAAARPDLGPSQSTPQPGPSVMEPVPQSPPTAELISDSDKE